jgi:hypothetical protein
LRTPRGKSISRDIQAIRKSLSTVARALGRLGPALAAATGAAPKAGVISERRKPTLSPARRRALKFQGQYMSEVRELGPRQKAAVKALREAKGVEAAIRYARKLSKR